MTDLMEFAKVAGPAALGTLVVVFMVVKFIPDMLSRHEAQMDKKDATFKDTIASLNASNERVHADGRALVQQQFEQLDQRMDARDKLLRKTLTGLRPSQLDDDSDPPEHEVRTDPVRRRVPADAG